MNPKPPGASTSHLYFTRTLATPTARLFAAVTEGRHLERWFCDACTSEPRAGGRLTMRWERGPSHGFPFEARWRVWNPPTRASFQGGHAGYPDGDAGTISFALTPDAAGTRLALLHEVPPGDAYTRFRREWEQAWPRALARLERYVSPPEAPPAEP